jgi:hypothetical protein
LSNFESTKPHLTAVQIRSKIQQHAKEASNFISDIFLTKSLTEKGLGIKPFTLEGDWEFRTQLSPDMSITGGELWRHSSFLAK